MFDDGNYLGTPSVEIFKPTGGNQASASVTIAEGGIDTITLTSGGSNYLSTPSVSFTPPNKPISSQIKFGNNSLYHAAHSELDHANFHFATNVDSRDTGNKRLSFSLWYYPTNFDPAGDYKGAVLCWTDRFKLYHSCLLYTSPSPRD